MTKVHLTSALEKQLQAAGLNTHTLVHDFSTWKSGGEDDCYLFAQDGLNHDSTVLRHAHMVPLNVTAAKKKWDWAWQKRRRRTSDRYLFYADGGPRLGYLLIHIIDDPGAHQVWQSQFMGLRKKLEEIADNFVHLGIIP